SDTARRSSVGRVPKSVDRLTLVSRYRNELSFFDETVDARAVLACLSRRCTGRVARQADGLAFTAGAQSSEDACTRWRGPPRLGLHKRLTRSDQIGHPDGSLNVGDSLGARYLGL